MHVLLPQRFPPDAMRFLLWLARPRTGPTKRLPPDNSDLPEGTYITASLPGALQLVEHLEAHPESRPGHRFSNVSESPNLIQTILDLDAVSSRILEHVWDEPAVPDTRSRNVLDRDFPRLTHLTLRGPQWKFDNLPGEQTFLRSVHSLTHLHVVSDFFPPLSVVRKPVPNATHVRLSGDLPVEFPTTHPLIELVGRSGPGIQYDCWLARLARNRDLHLSLPANKDFNQYGVTYESSRLFPLSRAITEFEDRIRGGEREWAVL
ncbi:hypothetical protein DFH07DRAFT_782005 [Mycena maculata]|uniref:Uncharacterized protein n=1 Tax=Mycena maculata TaxID=230809 RepID=A0AAD7MR12_9AGAR|nr:hypothetical protein DFH07DRAFT_782005 [Mycena maculata]